MLYSRQAWRGVLISIHPAREGDAAILTAIGLRAWENATSAIGVTEELRDNARHAFGNFAQSSWQSITVAALDGAIVGWAARENFDNQISDFWIDPSYQRRGIGTVLLQDIERQIIGRGFETGKLESHAQNDQAVSFFRKHGYGVSWLSLKYSAKLDRDVQSIGLQKQLVETVRDSYGFGF
jgi:ribosomal-protein-alanine N-acetyltransferase